jgi:phosphoserine phosphatase
MRIAVTLVARTFDLLEAGLEAGLEAVVSGGSPISDTRILGDGAMDIVVERGELASLKAALARALERHAIDICVQPAQGRRKQLLVADMDSTIIGCECLDEIADMAGIKAEIAAITERAMAGELDFEDALIARVGRLAGLETSALATVYDKRVRLNPGAATLAGTMAAHGARCVLVSGGFDFFTARVAAAAGFHAHRANRLIEAGGRLNGEVARPILGREAKLAALREEAETLGIGLGETLAVGDGANDLAMIEAAGLGVAWRAKPIVAAAADAHVDHADLTALLYFQGYSADEFA